MTKPRNRHTGRINAMKQCVISHPESIKYSTADGKRYYAMPTGPGKYMIVQYGTAVTR